MSSGWYEWFIQERERYTSNSSHDTERILKATSELEGYDGGGTRRRSRLRRKGKREASGSARERRPWFPLTRIGWGRSGIRGAALQQPLIYYPLCFLALFMGSANCFITLATGKILDLAKLLCSVHEDACHRSEIVLIVARGWGGLWGTRTVSLVDNFCQFSKKALKTDIKWNIC